MKTWIRRATLVVLVAIVVAAPAAADDRKWEIDIHGALGVSTQPTSGVAMLGDPTTPIGTVPTYFFGDGGVLLGRMSQVFRLGQPTTIDRTLNGSIVERAAGGGFGIRVGRAVTPRWSIELSFDNGFARTRIADSARSALDQAGATFTSTFDALLGFAGRQQSVASAVSVDNRRGRQLRTIGAVSINVANRGRFTPYVTGGAGATIERDATATARLVGSYTFGLPLAITLVPGIPAPSQMFHETDTVTIRSSQASAFTGLVGGGVRFAKSDRWGLRADVRDHISPNRITTIVDATPTADRNGSFVAYTSFGVFNGPSIQVSTVPGIPSTLSGKLTDMQTFRGTGVRHEIDATVGVYWRF